MRMTRILAAASLIFALGTSLALADDSAKDWSKVVIGTEGAYPPFNFLSASGELQGFDVDIAKALCTEMKVECTFVTQNWDGIIPALQNGNFDAILASMSITPEREQQIAFSSKYYRTPPAIAVPKDSAIAAATPEALSGKAIGAQTGTTHSQAAEALFPDADIRIYPTAEEYKLDIGNGRLDAVMDDVVVLSEWVKSPDGACCKILGTLPADPAIYGRGVGVGLRKGDDKLKKMFDDAIVAIRANGTYKTVQDKYFDFDVYGQ